MLWKDVEAATKLLAVFPTARLQLGCFYREQELDEWQRTSGGERKRQVVWSDRGLYVVDTVEAMSNGVRIAFQGDRPVRPGDEALPAHDTRGGVFRPLSPAEIRAALPSMDGIETMPTEE